MLEIVDRIDKIVIQCLREALDLDNKFEILYDEYFALEPIYTNAIEDMLHDKNMLEIVHSRILYGILRHNVIANSFVKYFFPSLVTDNSLINVLQPDHKRIDLSIKCNNSFIIIENKVNNSKQENSEVATYSVTNTIKKEANNQKNIVQENNNQVVDEVNTAIVKQNEIENNNKDSAINKEIPQEKVLVEENTAPTEEYKINEKKIAEIRNIINSNPSEDMKLYGYEIVVDSSITEITTQFTFTEKRVKDKIAWKFGTIRIYAQDYYRNGQYITTECYLI